MTAKLKEIISEEMLANMNTLAVTNVGMKDILEQAKVIYALNGSPNFFEYGDEDDDIDSYIDEDDIADEEWS